MNILERANEIVNLRSEEKTRQYGDFDDSMNKMRDIYNIMTGQNLRTEDMYLVMLSLKLSRLSYAYKEDSLLDAIAYLGALGKYLEKNNLYV